MCLTVFLALFFIYLFLASGCIEKTHTLSFNGGLILYVWFLFIVNNSKKTEQLLIDCVCVSET